MRNIAIASDSNSGITQSQAEELGVFILPMPFFINGETFYEDKNLTQEQFYQKLESGNDISTSMPLVGDLTDFWDELLQTHEQVVYIPMSSGLSSSCETATMLSSSYEGRVIVVNNQRISVTQRQSVLDALQLKDEGKSVEEIKNILERIKKETSIYIMVDTLTYLKKGGRITPAAAALGTLLKLKPVLQIQGEKLDAFAKARTVKQAKQMMIDAVKKDCKERFSNEEMDQMHIQIAYTANLENALLFKEQVVEAFPGHEVVVNPLSLSVSCHIGPGALALATCKKLEYCQ